MFKKHIIFQILYIIIGPLCPASLKRFVFYEVPTSENILDLWAVDIWQTVLLINAVIRLCCIMFQQSCYNHLLAWVKIDYSLINETVWYHTDWKPKWSLSHSLSVCVCVRAHVREGCNFRIVIE